MLCAETKTHLEQCDARSSNVRSDRFPDGVDSGFRGDCDRESVSRGGASVDEHSQLKRLDKQCWRSDERLAISVEDTQAHCWLLVECDGRMAMIRALVAVWPNDDGGVGR